MPILLGVGVDMIEIDRDGVSQERVGVTGRKEEYPPEWYSKLRK